MRKSFLWIATTLSGLMVGGVAYADTNQDGTATSRHATTTNMQTGRTAVNGQSVPCPPHRVLTPEQRRLRAEAARRTREQRQADEEARLAEAQRLRDAEAQARTDAQTARNDADQARLAAEQARMQQAATQRALDAERAHREQLASILAEQQRLAERHRLHRNAIARGGGPIHYRPLFTFGFDGGVAGYAGNTNRQEAYVGGSWGGRIGVDFADWIGIEGRYFGMANPLFAPNVGAGTIVTNGGTGVLRLTVPTKWVQPYGFAGAGVYNSQVWRPAGSNDANTIVAAAGNRLAVPLGIGLNIPIGRVVSVAAEGTYHALWNIDDTSTTTSTIHEFTNGIWNGTAVLRFRL